MKAVVFGLLLMLAVSAAGCGPEREAEESADVPATTGAPEADMLDLPAPSTDGTLSLEQALARRRSVREFTDQPLAIHELAQLFWAAQGTTRANGGRTAPSAGALYPLELYAATPDGLLHYVSQGHRAATLASDDLRRALARAALGQAAVEEAAVVFVIAAVTSRTAAKYGARAERYVQLEAGHAGQNLLLQAVALGLGGVPIGAFDDEAVKDVLGLPAGCEPLYLVPVGHPEG